MKYVLISLSESSKLDLSGAEKLGKTDHLVFVHAKGKKTVSAKLKEILSDCAAEVEYFEAGDASDVIPAISYLIGYYTAGKKDVFVLTADKDKLPVKICKDIKVYSAMKSITGGTGKSAANSTKSSSSKTGTAKKTVAKKTAAKKTTSKKSTASKSAAKKTTAKKSTAKKSTAKKDSGVNVTSLLDSLSKGDTKKISKQFTDLATQLMKGK